VREFDKCDNTKFERVQLQDEHALFEVWDFHHKDVTSMSNLKMTMEITLHSLCSLMPIKRGNMQRHNFKEREKKIQSKSNQQ
jgi:hypothetical protein